MLPENVGSHPKAEGGGCTVVYFEQFCAISKVLMVLMVNVCEC